MNNKYLTVEGHPHLVRDVRTNAIVNMDDQAHKAYVTLRDARKKEYNKMTDIEMEVDTIKSDLDRLQSDISEIKDLLKKLVR